ncbi:hypothetical protein D9M72_302930 [compost metagenome]
MVAAANADAGQVQRALVDPLAHHAVQRFERVHANQLKVRLDAGILQAAQVFFRPGRACRNDHFTVGIVRSRIGEGRAFVEFRIDQLHDVHLDGVERYRHLVRFRVQFGQCVSGVVRQPLGSLAIVFRCKRNRAADLNDHVRHRLAHAGDQFVEHGQALGALAIRFAHMQVQHAGACLIAIDGLLDLRFHGHRDVFGEIFRHPLRTVGGHRDHDLVHVLRVQRIIQKLHFVLLYRGVAIGAATNC